MEIKQIKKRDAGNKRVILELEEFMEFLDTPRTNEEICERFGISKELARKHINKLVDEGLLWRNSFGAYWNQNFNDMLREQWRVKNGKV